MTNRERLLKTLNREIPDYVPVAPDFSNMIPARLTGKPFWDLYLYNDPPIWEAYVDCAKHFDIDAVMDGYFPLVFPEEKNTDGPEWKQYIVFRNDERIVTQRAYGENGTKHWHDRVDVYYAADPPTHGVEPSKINLPPVPETYEPLEGVHDVLSGEELLADVKKRMGEQGLVGVWLTGSIAFSREEGIFRYYDNPDKHEQWAQERIEAVEKRFGLISRMKTKPDFLCVGGSGTLIWQTVEMFRTVAYPAVRRAIELAQENGYITHLHSCGPEAALVEIMAEETDLTVIDPLEIPPMGDCNLAELKNRFGSRIVLKGNLHTTQVMLNGTADDVAAASRQAIDDAAENGGFILSTGDQCGRDTPDENLFAMVETARSYGRY